MSEMIGTHAMLLSAGLGLRMRPLTASRPKPLVEVNGKALIDFGLAKLVNAGVKKVVVNVHHFPEQVEAWALRQVAPEIKISDERRMLLDTGGGVALALPLLGSEPFFVLNSDSIWIDGKVSALHRLRSAWRDQTMDCLLLLCSLHKAIGYSGSGDFTMNENGRLLRSDESRSGAVVYIGVCIIHPRLFSDAPNGRYSMNVVWDNAIANGRLYGLVHDGLWLHVGTPESVRLAEAEIEGRI